MNNLDPKKTGMGAKELNMSALLFCHPTEAVKHAGESEASRATQLQSQSLLAANLLCNLGSVSFLLWQLILNVNLPQISLPREESLN